MFKKRRRRKIIISLSTLVVFIFLAWISFAPQFIKNTDNTIVVGVMSGSKKDDKILDTVKEIAWKKYKLKVNYKHFSDYTQPNKALQDGDIDLNSFQHIAFLNAWNQKNKTDLTAVGNTIIAPVKLYSYKYKSLDDIPFGATISIPNDATNESRALFLLEKAGLIKLSHNTKLATIKDIIDNPKDLIIKELDASQTARSLHDVALAAVNGNYAITANLSQKDVVFVETVNNDTKQWVNVIVSRKKDKNNPKYKKFVQAYQTDDVAKIMKQEYGDSQLPVW